MAMNLLGRLGGKARSTLRGAISLPTLRPTNSLPTTLNQSPLSLGLIAELAVQLLHRNLIMDSLEGTEGKLSMSLRTSAANIRSIRNIRKEFKTIAVNFLYHCLVACCEKTTRIDLSMAYSFVSVFDPPASQVIDHLSHTTSEHPHADNDNDDNDNDNDDADADAERVVSLMLLGLLYACCDVEVRSIARSHLHSLLSYFVCLLVQSVHPNTTQRQSPLWKEPITLTDASVIQQSNGVLPPPPPTLLHQTPGQLSPTLIFRALAGLMTRGDASARKVMKEVSDEIRTLLDEVAPTEADRIRVHLACWEYFLNELLLVVHHDNWKSRVRLVNMMMMIVNDDDDGCQ